MKHIFIFIAAVCLFTSHAATTVVYQNNKSTKTITRTENNQSGVTFDFNLPRIEDQKGLLTEFGQGSKLVIPDDRAVPQKPGEPDASAIEVMVRIPNRGTIALSTSNVQTKPLGTYMVMPVQTPQPISGEPVPYIQNKEIYETNDLFPKSNATLVSCEILGDIRIARIALHPLKVNPVSNEAIAITAMKVHVTFEKGRGEDELTMVDRGITRSFLPFYRQVINFDGAAFAPFDKRVDPGCYVFIGNQASLKAVEDFSNWKIRKGYDVKIQDIAEIGSDDEALDKWLEDAYASWPNKPEYILLCGGEDIVPTATRNKAESDNGFGTIGTSSHIPSMHVGRITAKNGDLKSLTYQTWKIRMYEMDPFEGNTDWMISARTWGSTSPNGITPNGRIADMYESKGFASVIQDKERQNPKTGTALVNELSKGLSVMSYIAHGSKTSWSSAKVSTSQISAIKNGRMIPWIWNIACTNSSFKGRLCFAEAWMCAGTIEEPGGCLGMISYAPNATTSSIPMFEKGQEAYFTNKELWHMGACVTYAKQFIRNSKLDRWGGIFWGCPEVDLYLTAKPLAKIKAEHPNPKPGAFGIKVANDDGAIEGALVGIATTDHKHLASGYTDNSGELTVILPNYQADSVFVTVTYHNHRPYLGTFKSGGVFDIKTPKYGDVFDVDEEIAITWKTEEGPVDKVKIEFSKDNGQTYSTIEASVDNTESYKWKAPDVGSEECLIKISDASTVTRNSASGTFAIFNVSTLSGKVSGITPADVHYIGTKTGSIASNNQGNYTLEKLFPGTYAVFAQAGEHTSDTAQVTLPPDNSGVNLEVKFPTVTVNSDRIWTQLMPERNVAMDLTVSNKGKRDLKVQLCKGKLGDLKINELYVPVDEFYDGFEIRNQGPDLDVSGWKIEWKDNQNTSGSYTFKKDVVIKSGKTLIIMDEEQSANDSTIFVGSNLFWDMGETELSLAILDNTGKGVDFVKTAGNNDTPPQGTSWSGDGVSLSNNAIYRNNDGDSDGKDDWAGNASASFNTPNPGQTACMLPSWISHSTFSASVAPAGSKNIKLSFDAKGLQVGNNKSALIFMYHNSPKESSPIAVTCTLSVVDEIAIQNSQKKPRVSGLITAFSVSPNPVNRNVTRSTLFTFEVNAKKCKQFEAKLILFDPLGGTLFEQELTGSTSKRGPLTLGPWNLTNKSGRKVKAGSYLALLKVFDSNGNYDVKKLLVGVKN